MTQKKIAELFGVQRPAITKHLKNIFESGELVENSVSSILEHTADDGKKYKTTFYNLDTIIAVGYRVNSNKATKFRIWSTKMSICWLQQKLSQRTSKQILMNYPRYAPIGRPNMLMI
jgi:hypothetical protein